VDEPKVEKGFKYECVVPRPAGVGTGDWKPEYLPDGPPHYGVGGKSSPGWYARGYAWVGGAFGWAPTLHGPFADEVACRAWCEATLAAEAKQ
jgi:hypothetical protein